jgi:hypothetical protein
MEKIIMYSMNNYYLHPTLVLHPSCIPEKVGIIKYDIPIKILKYMRINRPKGGKTK